MGCEADGARQGVLRGRGTTALAGPLAIWAEQLAGKEIDQSMPRRTRPKTSRAARPSPCTQLTHVWRSMGRLETKDDMTILYMRPSIYAHTLNGWLTLSVLQCSLLSKR